MEDILNKARIYEKENEGKIDKERPSFHLTPRVGWMNDPNGFCYYKGQYHMFYQYHPYDNHWGPMHWGHAVSSDLLHWEYLPVALAPDKEYDKRGCFSGSAVELPDGRHLIMYTGVSEKTGPDGSKTECQTQCVAVGDGVEYVKYENNPVLTSEDVPEGGSYIDFRDPKLWVSEDGTIYCIVGNRSSDTSGQMLLYKSMDGFKWEFVRILVRNRNSFGKMWECPDFFCQNGEWVLLTSPQDMKAVPGRYNSGNGTLALIGRWDTKDSEFVPEHDQCIDNGIDYYAPQTVLTPDGRRIMIGWMQNWDTCNSYVPSDKWCGQMAIPREVCVKDGRMYQTPSKEVENLRGDLNSVLNMKLNGSYSADILNGRKVDLTVKVKPSGEHSYDDFEIRFFEGKDNASASTSKDKAPESASKADDTNYAFVKYDARKSEVTLSREYAGIRRAIVNKTSCKVDDMNGQIEFRIILDKYSAEVFINGGRYAMTMNVYNDLSCDKISFRSHGEAVVDILKYDLDKA